MMNGRNNGKKLMAVRIVAHAFEIVRLITERHCKKFSNLEDGAREFVWPRLTVNRSTS